jgi:hypothetical protein
VSLGTGLKFLKVLAGSDAGVLFEIAVKGSFGVKAAIKSQGKKGVLTVFGPRKAPDKFPDAALVDEVVKGLVFN